MINVFCDLSGLFDVLYHLAVNRGKRFLSNVCSRYLEFQVSVCHNIIHWGQSVCIVESSQECFFAIATYIP